MSHSWSTFLGKLTRCVLHNKAAVPPACSWHSSIQVTLPADCCIVPVGFLYIALGAPSSRAPMHPGSLLFNSAK